MNIKSYHHLAARALLWATFQFIILTIAAMFVFPGGHIYNHNESYYNFTYNYFSDLGATKTVIGKENLLSQILFMIALSVAGIGMICFAVTTRLYITGEGGKRVFFAKLAACMLGFSGGCFIAIAALPIDIYFAEHNVFVKAAFSFLLAYSMVICSLQVQNAWPKPYVIANLIYMLSLVVYVAILFKGPTYETVNGLKFQVVSQKVIAYISVMNLGYQAVGILKKTRQIMV